VGEGYKEYLQYLTTTDGTHRNLRPIRDRSTRVRLRNWEPLGADGVELVRGPGFDKEPGELP